MGLLREIVERNHYLFAREAGDWEEALRMGCRPLEADGTVDGGYAGELIDSVKKHGPYIVLLPGFAMPHTMEGARGVNATAIGFMKLERPVSFDPSDAEKDASVFFTLAAQDSERHLANMRRLFKLLTNEELVERLRGVTGVRELLELDEAYG